MNTVDLLKAIYRGDEVYAHPDLASALNAELSKEGIDIEIQSNPHVEEGVLYAVDMKSFHVAVDDMWKEYKALGK